MQMISVPWGVSVYGSASVKAAPDLVRLRFKISRTAQTPAAAFEAVRTAVRAVRGVLRDHGVGDGAVERSRLNLQTSYEYEGNKRVSTGYSCSAAFAAESRALDDVEQLLVDVVTAGANEIEGVDFDVLAKRELRADARRKAVVAARAKAELYAEAAGGRIGTVVHIEDVDPERDEQQMRSRSHSSFAASQAQDLAPGHIVVSAAVTVGFELITE
jgi:uncharacterized protein YggE